MGQILIRNIDDEFVTALKSKAAASNESLEGFARRLLINEAKRPSRAEILARVDELRRRIGPLPGSSTPLIREDRDNDEPYR